MTRAKSRTLSLLVALLAAVSMILLVQGAPLHRIERRQARSTSSTATTIRATASPLTTLVPSAVTVPATAARTIDSTPTVVNEEEGGGVQGFPIVGSDGSQVDDELGALPPPMDDLPAEDEPWDGGEVAENPDPLDDGGVPVSFPEDNLDPDDDPLTGDQLDEVLREWLNEGGNSNVRVTRLEGNMPNDLIGVTTGRGELPEIPPSATIPNGAARVTEIGAAVGGFIPPGQAGNDVIEVPPPTDVPFDVIPTDVPILPPAGTPVPTADVPVTDVIGDLVANLPPLPADVADAINGILQSLTMGPTPGTAPPTPTAEEGDGGVVGIPSRPTQIPPQQRMRTIFTDQFGSPLNVGRVWTAQSGQCLASQSPNFCFSSAQVNLHYNSTVGIAQMRSTKQLVSGTGATTVRSLFTGAFISSGIPLTKPPSRWALDVLFRIPTSPDVQPIVALAFGNRVVVNLALGTVNVEQGPTTIATVAEKLASPQPLPYPPSAPFSAVNASRPLRMTVTGTGVGRDVLITVYQRNAPEPVTKTVTLPSSMATMIQQAESVNKRFAVWPLLGTGISVNASSVNAPVWAGPTNQTGPLPTAAFVPYTLTIDSVRFGLLQQQ